MVDSDGDGLGTATVVRRKVGVAAALLAVTFAPTGCGDTDSWVNASPADGWPAQYSDAANSSYTRVTGARDLQLDWSRSVKGTLGAGPALGAGGWLVLNGQTESGCTLVEWENDNKGRQRWCTQLYPGGGFFGALLDGFDNVYVGQPGAMLSFPPTQWIRWRQPVIGMPSTPRILADGQILVVTHLGQVLVFDGHKGTVAGTPLDLVDGVDPGDYIRGLEDCAPAKSGCPVAAAPAYSTASGAVVVSVWQPDENAAGLVGLRYHRGGRPLITREWVTDVVEEGVLASPVLSPDGRTVYVNGRDEQLWALDADNGDVKWSAPLKFLAQTPPTVLPGGLIISGGGPETQLVGLRDHGDHAEEVWRRDDVTPLSTAGVAHGPVGYTVAAGTSVGPEGLSLLVFDPTDGHTVNSYPLPEAEGFPVGVAIGNDRRVVAATSAGQVYSFRPV